MFHSPFNSPPVDYATSSSSSARSTESSTGQHSPPPLWSDTDKIILRIKEFVDDGMYYFDSNDLIIPVQPEEFVAFQRELRRPKFIDRTLVSKIRYTWDRQTYLLTISCMAGPVHESIISYLIMFNQDMPSIHPITLSERFSMVMMTGCDVPLLRDDPLSIIYGRGKNSDGLCKVPDVAFKFIDRRPNAVSVTGGCPRVIVEVAVSQTYESVLEDARQWLVRSSGKVVLCVIFKVFEGPIRDGQAADPINEAGFDTSTPTDMVPSDFMTTMEARDRFLNSTEHTQWVGGLSGFVELYRLAGNGTSIVQDGPRYDLFDPSGPDPVILITDLLPTDAIEGSPDRAFPVRLDQCRMFLQEAVRDLALLRKLKTECCPEDVGDPDYRSLPDADEGEGASAGSSQKSDEAY